MQTHGQISYHPNPNPTLGEDHRNNKIAERCLVYTPPGYDEAKGGSYPVLYLLHGVGDVEFSWEVHGQVAAILDDLLKDKLIQPMIVVMPFGFESQDQKFKREFPTKKWFDGYLKNLMDMVESAYGIKVGKTADARSVKRAIAGLSMGESRHWSSAWNTWTCFLQSGTSAGLSRTGQGWTPYRTCWPLVTRNRIS